MLEIFVSFCPLFDEIVGRMLRMWRMLELAVFSMTT
jgi:hypothetical protein